MKISYKKLLSSLRTLLGKSGTFDPEKDWRIIFSTAIVIFFIALLFNGYIFLQVKSGEIFNTEVETQKSAPLVDEERLDSTLKYYDARQARFDEIRKVGVKTVDPSL